MFLFIEPPPTEILAAANDVPQYFANADDAHLD